jgi:hypothetical protein
MMDLNDFVPSDSGLVLTAGEYINDLGEIGASGVLPNGDHHAIVLLPCDDVEDCLSASNYNAGGKPTPRILSQEARPQRLDLHKTLAALHSRWARRYSRLSDAAGVWKRAHA